MIAGKQALGSAYGQQGYDLRRGTAAHEGQARCIEHTLLGARGSLSMENDELDAIEHTLLADCATYPRI